MVAGIRKVHAAIICALLLLLVQSLSVRSAEAQGSGLGWSKPEVIPAIDPTLQTPVLVADQARTVHAFSSQWIGEEGSKYKAVVYNQWTLANGWTNPTDILLSPIKEARVTDAYLDHNGIVHLIFWGGDGISADIYYSSAPLGALDKATSWSTPVLAAANAGDPESAVLIEDSQKNINILYYGKKEGSGLYIATSKDGGTSWSDATPVFLADNNAPVVSRIRAILSTSGWLHVIWNVYSEGGQGRGVYYAKAQDGFSAWNEPVLLAQSKAGLGSQTPTIFEYNQTLYSLYNMPPKITMRRSTDNGDTWSDPAILFPRHVGVNGSLAPVIDGNDELHLFFGQRITGNPDIHGMWQSLLKDGRWTEPDAVIKGPRIVDSIGLTSFDPVSAHAVVSQGNVILVTWTQDPDPNIRPNGSWYSYKILDAPEQPVQTVPAPVQVNGIPNVSPVPTSLTNEALTPVSTLLPSLKVQPNRTTIPSLIAVLGVMSLLLGVFVVNSLKGRR